MRRLSALLLACAACATTPATPSEPETSADEGPAIQLWRDIDRGGPFHTSLTDGMRGIFKSGLEAFGEDWRSKHGKLVRLRVAKHDGGSWDVDGLWEKSPFPERVNFYFDDRGRLAGVWFYGGASGDMTDAELQSAIAAIPGQVSLFAQAAEHRELTVAYRASEPQSVASQYKVMLLARACTEVGRGQRALTDRLPMPASARGTPSCILCNFEGGLEPTLHDILRLLVSASDNTAADWLRDLLGRDAVTRTAEANGIAHVPPLITTQGLFASECGLGPLRNVKPEGRAAYLARLTPDERVAATDDAARDGFGQGPDAFWGRCNEGHATSDSQKAIAHVIDWPMRADELVALYTNAQLGQLDSPAASRCFLDFMAYGGGGPLPIGGNYKSGGSKNGIEQDVRSVGAVVDTDRGPIAVSVSNIQFPDSQADRSLDLISQAAKVAVASLYAKLPPK